MRLIVRTLIQFPSVLSAPDSAVVISVVVVVAVPVVVATTKGVTEFELLQARLAIERAIAADDPVELARIAQQEAQLALRFAENQVEVLQAQAQIIEADNSFAAAIAESYSAQFDLAIAIANQNGDIDAALQLGTEQAEEALLQLRLTGAGDAAIAAGQVAVINAEIAQRDGAISEQISDLQFMFDMGDLTVAQFIANLEAILTAIDPEGQEDLYQSINRQILSLKESSGGGNLKFDIPDSLTPSLFEVRRLAQGIGSAASGTGGAINGLSATLGNTINNNNTITLTIMSDVDLDLVAEVLAEATGTDSSVFAFNGRKGG